MGDEPDNGDITTSGGSNGRLRDLETAEEKRRVGERLDRRFELFEATLLSVAAVLAAWTGFQAAKWDGNQADNYSRSGASRVEAVRYATLAGQEQTVDLITFTDWLAAGEQEGLFETELARDEVYQPDPELLSGFLYERFRPEFRVATDAWLQTRPGTNPDAPPTPFVMPEYELESSEQAGALEHEAEAFAGAARLANQRSDNYVLMTIMLATVLFFAGISSKMDTARARILLLSVGTTLLVVSAVVVMAFPKEL